MRKRKSRKRPVLYLAGRLFNAAERLHNLYLEKYLRILGYKVILPQREALRFVKGKKFDVNGIMKDCYRTSRSRKILHVGCIDGPDGDSGGAVEFGVAIGVTGKALVYRTDFRTDTDRELGYNAMYRIKGAPFVYLPCFFTELDQVEEYYATLAVRIDRAIQKRYKV